MAQGQSLTLRLRARGPLACFTRPELKVERVSYPVMTPSAARGVLEAVMWKPAIVWHIERIHVLNEIRFLAFKRNEVNYKAASPSRALVDEGGIPPICFADDESSRAQRNTVALRDVDYIIDAHFTITDRAGADDNIKKFIDMFHRRVDKGQHYHQPYFGCREFVAEIMPASDAPSPIQDTRDLGLMLWDITYGPKNTPTFFQAYLRQGILEVPAGPDSPTATGDSTDGGPR